MPARLAALNRFRAPWVSLILVGLLASAMVLMNYSRSLVEGFTFLTVVVTAASIPLYLFAALALVQLARREAEFNRPAIWLLAALGVLFVCLLLAGMGSEPFYLAMALAAAGLPLYGVMKWRSRTRVAPMGAA